MLLRACCSKAAACEHNLSHGIAECRTESAACPIHHVVGGHATTLPKKKVNLNNSFERAAQWQLLDIVLLIDRENYLQQFGTHEVRERKERKKEGLNFRSLRSDEFFYADFCHGIHNSAT